MIERPLSGSKASLKAVCPWCGKRLYETLGEGENICQAECRSDGCEELKFTVQTGRKDHIIFIEDDEGMIYSVWSNGWQRDKPDGARDEL